MKLTAAAIVFALAVLAGCAPASETYPSASPAYPSDTNAAGCRAGGGTWHPVSRICTFP